MAIQFEHEHPIISDQPIHSRAEGLEAIAKTLGDVSHKAFEALGDMGEQQSNAMYSQSQAHLDTFKTNAKIQMLQNPGQADKIAEATARNYDQIVNEAAVNKKDRQRLMLSATSDMNDIRLDAARTSMDVIKRGAAVSFFQQFPTVLSGIKESVANEKEFNNRLDSANKLVGTMVINGVLTPQQAETAYKAIHHTIDVSKDYLEAAGNPNLTAKDYHNLKGGIIGVDDGTHMNQPVDHNTLHVYDAHNSDTTLQTVKADIAKGGAGNPEAWFSMGDKERAHVVQLSRGSKSVDAEIKAGVPFTAFQHELKNYTARGTLSSFEEGRQERIKNILNDGGANAFEKTLAGNPIFRAAESEYNNTVAAVQHNPNLSPEQQASLIQQYDNNLTWKKVNLAESMHMPDAMVQPLAPSFVEPTKTAWVLDGNPGQLLSRIDYVQHGLKEYVARVQDTPLQQETTRIVGNIKGGMRVAKEGATVFSSVFGHNERITEQDRTDFVLAQQTNRDFSNLKLGESNTSDPYLKNQIAKNLSTTLPFLAVQSGGTTRGVAAVDATLNLIKYYAQKAGDLEMKNKDVYIKKATSIVNAAYPMASGTNWRVSTNDVPVSDWRMDLIANHVIGEAKAQLLEGVDPVYANQALDTNSLSVVSTPTGHLSVIDGYGSEIYRTRYRGSLLHYAVHDMNEKQSEAEKLINQIPAHGKSEGMIEEGNIDLATRAKVQNKDGSYSTVKTITIEEDGKTILLPTVINGKHYTNKGAIGYYRETGEHLGKFESEAAANKYDKEMHKKMNWEGKNNKWEEEAESGIAEDEAATKLYEKADRLDKTLPIAGKRTGKKFKKEMEELREEAKGKNK